MYISPDIKNGKVYFDFITNATNAGELIEMGINPKDNIFVEKLIYANPTFQEIAMDRVETPVDDPEESTIDELIKATMDPLYAEQEKLDFSKLIRAQLKSDNQLAQSTTSKIYLNTKFYL